MSDLHANYDNNQGEIVIYQSENGDTKIDVRFVDETVWLTQQQMAELFQSSRTNIVEHIQHIYEEGELDEESTCRKFRQVRMEGLRQVTREIPHYNLDMIISLGYRVKSMIATPFRRLKEYMIKGFTMDDERLKNLGGSVPVATACVKNWRLRKSIRNIYPIRQEECFYEIDYYL